MSSKLGASLWAPSVEETLTRGPDATSGALAATGPLSMPSELPQRELEASADATTDRKSSGLRARLLSVDVATVAVLWLVLGGLSMPATTEVRQWGAALAATGVTLAAMQLVGLYRSRLCVQRGQEMARISIAVLIGEVAFVLIRGDGEGARGPTIVAVSCVLALIVFRWIFGQWLCAQRARGRFLRGIVMIGANDDAVEVLTMLDSQPELGYEVRGIIGETLSCPEWAHLRSGRTLDELPGIASLTNATGVLVVANALSSAEVNRVIELSAANGLHVQVCPGFRGLATRRVRSLPMSGEAFLYVEPGRRPPWQLAAKRLIDVLGASIAVLIAAPILLLAWVAIRLEDSGPALYRQVRIGLHGQPFVVYKLRSMTLDADNGVDDSAVVNERTDGPLFKSVHDPRVTRVGAVIRALSIDEIPQLFNVLIGTMSLVGPRPALAREVAQFDPEFLRRHDVKQGMTGLWQIEARDNPSFHAYRRLDLLYVDNWSIGLDLVILLATVPMVMAHALKLHGPVGRSQEAPSDA